MNAINPILGSSEFYSSQYRLQAKYCYCWLSGCNTISDSDYRSKMDGHDQSHGPDVMSFFFKDGLQ